MTEPQAISADSIEMPRRLAAIAALLLGAATVVVGAVGLRGDVARAIIAVVLLLVAIGAAWSAATRTGTARVVAAAVAVVALVGVSVVTLTAEGHGLGLVLVLALSALSAGTSRYALHRDRTALQQAPSPGTPVGPAVTAALIINPKSGGGKATIFNLEQEARRRGIQPIVLTPGDDLLQLAKDAIDGGVDVIGMAGGDGSQALVASVAMGADVALVCIPAGTRNHFALDIGLDRDDVVGALDAFGNASERRIDLAKVGDRVFVNNVSLGVYAKIVQSPEYRDAKRQTTARMLPELLGPEAEPFGLRFTTPDGTEHDTAQIIMVSNNAYTLSPLGGMGTRARLDTGRLGIGAAEVHGATEAAAFIAAESTGYLDRFPGWFEWTSAEFTVDSDRPVEAGVDGEALTLDPPLVFRSLPGAIRIRIPTHAPGLSPAALKAPSPWWSVTALVRTAFGHTA